MEHSFWRFSRLLRSLRMTAKEQKRTDLWFRYDIIEGESRERESLLLTGDTGTESIQTDIYFLIASIDLLDVADDACTLG